MRPPLPCRPAKTRGCWASPGVARRLARPARHNRLRAPAARARLLRCPAGRGVRARRLGNGSAAPGRGGEFLVKPIAVNFTHTCEG